jgi:hypothetical protein
MKTKVTFDEKRKAVYDWHMKQDKSYLCSKIMALFYNKDLEQEYKELPNDCKLKK